MVMYCENKYHMLSAGGGVEIALKEFVYKADEDGKHIYIQAGLHGGETSQWCLYQLHDFLLKNLQKGEVHIVPYANPSAWMQRIYGATFGKFSLLDGKDYNRCFEGNSQGDVNARICNKMMNLALKADLVVDLHTSKSSKPFVIYTQEKYKKWVKACGLKYNQYSDDAAIWALQGTFNAALDRAGVENITIECGGHDEYVEANNEAVLQGLIGILGQAEMVDKINCKVATDMYRFEKRMKVFAPKAGLFKTIKNLGETVQQGETLGYILSAESLAVKEAVTSPVNGMLQILSRGHIVWEGDVTAEVVPLTDLQMLTDD